MHNENATTGVDARNRCGRFPAARCKRPGVRAHGRRQATTFRICRDVAEIRIADVLGWPPTCAYADVNRLKSNEAILRREFVPRDPWQTS